MQYPYTLYVLQAAELTVDENGNAVPASAEWAEYAACRDEANDGGKLVTLDDSQSLQYAAVIYLPLGTPVLTVGTLIQVRNRADDSLRIGGTVRRFLPDRFHCRLWL